VVVRAGVQLAAQTKTDIAKVECGMGVKFFADARLLFSFALAAQADKLSSLCLMCQVARFRFDPAKAIRLTGARAALGRRGLEGVDFCMRERCS